MKWVPIVCPVHDDPPPVIVPPAEVVVPRVERVVDAAIVHVASSAAKASVIEWSSNEQNWIHQPSEMKYDPD